MTQKYESLSFWALFDDVDALLDSLSVRFRVILYRGSTALSGVGTDRLVTLSLADVVVPLPVTKPFTKLFKLFMITALLKIWERKHKTIELFSWLRRNDLKENSQRRQ